MGDNADLHRKIHDFLLTEWARKDNRQLVEVHLMYAPTGGYRNEPIRKWVRADEPEFFAEIVNVEKLVTLIVEIAEGEVDAKPPGRHSFRLRTQQHLGEQASMSFALQPSYNGQDETTIMPNFSGGRGGGGGGGGGGSEIAAAQILASNNGQLMRINTQMFDGTIRVLGHQVQNLHEQVIALTAENSKLRTELEEARSNRMDREFQMAMAHEKNARSNAALQKVLQLGTVVVAKIGADGSGAQQVGEGNPLAMLISEFYQSLREDQRMGLVQILDMPQKIMFFEIVKLVAPQPNQGSGQPPPGGPNGAR
jgi:regulator of replication initiation timing